MHNGFFFCWLGHTVGCFQLPLSIPVQTIICIVVAFSTKHRINVHLHPTLPWREKWEYCTSPPVSKLKATLEVINSLTTENMCTFNHLNLKKKFKKLNILQINSEAWGNNTHLNHLLLYHEDISMLIRFIGAQWSIMQRFQCGSDKETLRQKNLVGFYAVTVRGLRQKWEEALIQEVQTLPCYIHSNWVWLSVEMNWLHVGVRRPQFRRMQYSTYGFVVKEMLKINVKEVDQNKNESNHLC